MNEENGETSDRNEDNLLQTRGGAGNGGERGGGTRNGEGGTVVPIYHQDSHRINLMRFFIFGLITLGCS